MVRVVESSIIIVFEGREPIPRQYNDFPSDNIAVTLTLDAKHVCREIHDMQTYPLARLDTSKSMETKGRVILALESLRKVARMLKHYVTAQNDDFHMVIVTSKPTCSVNTGEQIPVSEPLLLPLSPNVGVIRQSAQPIFGGRPSRSILGCTRR